VIDVADLQGGIVRGYGQRFGFARHLFARVREPRAARAFLAALADPVTTEQEWSGRPDTTLNVALSYRALAALGLPAWILDGFPAELRDGMAARADRLGDDPTTWDDELRELEVLLVVHAQSADALEAEAGRWERALGAPESGLELAHAQPAALLGQQREHFGFTDGFSQPAIEGVAREDVRGQGIPYKRVPWWPLSRTRWRAIKPGEFVLGYEDEDRGPAPAPPAPFDRNASYMVWRKLGQDVGGFRAQLAEQARRLALDEELVAAKLVGRWRDGSPLVLRPDGPDPELGNDKRRVNDFRYGDDQRGLRCPRGAHVRRTNPRDTLGWEGRLTARHRILRRGMPYGPALPDGAADCSSSPCRPPSRASSRSSSRSGATTATRSAWAARPIRSLAPPAARCATSSRASRRTWSRPCAATSSAAAASTSSCRPSAPCGRCPRSDAAGHKRRPRAMNTPGAARWNTVPCQVTPSGQTHSWRANCHDESRTCPPPDADPPDQRGHCTAQGRGRPHDAA
jgi:deferrochelatase/peroxidase EfeB